MMSDETSAEFMDRRAPVDLPMIKRAERLEAVAERLVKAVSNQRRVLKVVSAALIFDLLLTFGMANALVVQCDGRNLDAKRNHNLWAPLIAQSTNPNGAAQFKGQLDKFFPQIDCSYIAVTRRAITHKQPR
jgi:hypothetical protein